MAEENSKIEISTGTLDASITGAFSVGAIYGIVGKQIDKLPSSAHPHELGIKELLNQLHQTIDEPDLSENDKGETLELLRVLAEAEGNPKVNKMQMKAERAVEFLDITLKGVEPSSKLAQAGVEVLPKILLFFGL